MHHDLIPYTRSYLYQATQTGMPVMRSLIFAYPTDASLYDTWDEYLYGQDLLVAPVVTPNALGRKVYLPAGRWMNYNDRATVYGGGTSITADAPLGTLPLFVREGGIIARGDILKSNNNWDANWAPKLRIEVFPSKDTASEFSYYTGEGVRTIEVRPGGAGLEIKMENLGVGGSLEVYCRGNRGVTRNGTALREGADYQYDEKQQKLTIPFDGASTFIITGASSLFDTAISR